MAIYGKFIGATGNTREAILLRIIYKNLDQFFSNKKIYIFSKNLIYVDNSNEDEIEKIIDNKLDFILGEYTKALNLDSLSGKQNAKDAKGATINAIKKIFYSLFVQTYIILPNKFSTKTFQNYESFQYSKSDSIQIENFNNADNELMNFFRYKYEKFYKQKYSFPGYMCLAYSGQSNLVEAPLIYFKGYSGKKLIDSPISKWEINKLLQLLLTPNEKWYRSSELTAKLMIKSSIFDNSDYIFYSEDSKTYKDIFNVLSGGIASSKIFDTYFRALNINKYFISDVLAVKSEGDLKIIKKLIDNFITNKNIINLKKVFNKMDEFFIEKKFIPISLKMIEDYSPEEIPKDLVTKEEIESSGIKIINKPSKMQTDISLDDFDLLLLDILLKIKNKIGNIKDILNENISINYQTFKYSNFMTLMTYGGSIFPGKYPHTLYFEFDVNIQNKKKTYLFEVTGGSTKIRRKGTASASGEGSIKTETINYVLKQVYNNSVFNNQLTKIANNRMRNRGQGQNYKNLSPEYKNFMSKRRIITPNDREILERIIPKSPENEEHYKNYYKFLTNKTYKNIGNATYGICGKELGELLDSNVELHGEHVKVILEEYKKKQFISSMWGLVSARGPIQFLDKTFTTATGLEDIAKYQIKFPALVKIGI